MTLAQALEQLTPEQRPTYLEFVKDYEAFQKARGNRYIAFHAQFIDMIKAGWRKII